MRTHLRWIAVLVVAAAALAAGGVLAGRASVDPHHDKGYSTGRADGYFDGLRVGEAQGRQDGRAIQEVQLLPAGERQVAKDAFDDGYAAGTNDVFAGYDGGWALTMPYVITVEQGTGEITYRIRSREPVEPHVNYYLCANGHSLCQESRR